MLLAPPQSHAASQPSVSPQVFLRLYVQNVDPKTAQISATLNATLLVPSPPYPAPTLHPTNSRGQGVLLSILGFGAATTLNLTYYGSTINETNYVFQGSVPNLSWPITGTPQWYPFDSYHADFTIGQVLYDANGSYYSLSNTTIDSQQSSFRFSGGEANILKGIWQTSNPYGDILSNYSALETTGPAPANATYIENPSASIVLIKNANLSSFLQFLPLFLPILFLYALLGASMFTGQDGQERILVYTSLFVFAGTFFFSIQSFLPLRSSISFIEVIVVAAFIPISTLLIALLWSRTDNPGTKGDSQLRWLNVELRSLVGSLMLVMFTFLLFTFVSGVPVPASIDVALTEISLIVTPLLLGFKAYSLRRKRLEYYAFPDDYD